MHVDEEVHGHDAEFEAEFAKLSGGAPADEARDEPEPKDEDQPAGDPPASDDPGADKAPEPEVKDPWAGASPEIIAERDKLLHQQQSDRGRIAGMNRTIEELRSGAPRQPQAQEPKPDPEQEDAAKQRAERFKAFAEDYPDVGGVVEILREEIEAVRKNQEALGQRVAPAIDASSQAAVAAQLEILAGRHPDWREVGNSADYQGWAAAQSEAVQRLINSDDAIEASAAITLFKQERDASRPKDDPKPDDPKPNTQQRDDRRERQLHGARGGSSRPAPAAGGVPDDFEAAFAAEQRKRQAPRGR